MKYFIYDGDVNQCYGCGSCSQICPSQSIIMVANSEGFVFPQIDNTKCIECNLCEKTCPAIKSNSEKVKNHLPHNVYAAWNNDLKQVMKSTSAAIFPLLAEFILDKGGVVYGCAWAENKIHAIHIRTTNKEELNKLKGSKYVQSEIGNTFIQVKDDLEKGFIVLYSGTPCQIAGLKLFLQKEYDNLYLVDLVCHGTPSPKMLSAYVSSIENKGKKSITELKFRDKKKTGFRSYISWINTKTKKKEYRLGGIESYLFGFYRSYFNRESCYICKFSSSNRPGDITLSDFWGIEKYIPELKSKRKYGLNMIMCNSNKGMYLFSNIKSKITYIHSNIEYAQKGDIRLLQNGKRPELRDRIYKDLNKNGFDFLVKSYLKPPLYLIRRFIPAHIKNVIHLIKM